MRRDRHDGLNRRRPQLERLETKNLLSAGVQGDLGLALDLAFDVIHEIRKTDSPSSLQVVEEDSPFSFRLGDDVIDTGLGASLATASAAFEVTKGPKGL